MTDPSIKAAQSIVRKNPPPEGISFSDFLAQVPPGEPKNVTNLLTRHDNGWWHVSTPDIELHCSNPRCGGKRVFRYAEGDTHLDENDLSTFIEYICSNCQTATKRFALFVQKGVQYSRAGIAQKYGEVPAFGPPTPTRLLTILGDEQDTFLKGRRCENQGLGIGAFAYYRRIVENQKNRILDEVVKVAETVNADARTLTELREARNESQFSKAMKAVPVPQTLLINGHNPLALLHDALSDGLHAGSDEECLEFATEIRIVLAELAEKVGSALKDDQTLNQVLGNMTRRRAEREKKKAAPNDTP